MDWSPESVLDYGARTHRKGLRWKQRRLLLWPAWAWRVVAPEVQERKLDPLQRVVLRLRIAGLRRYTEIGELLGLEPDLVVYVARQLQGTALLDSTGAPTERAARFLEAAELDAKALRVGWVFQDSHSGQLFPRFVADLQVAASEPGDDGRPRVTTGSKGRPFQARAFLVPDGSAPALRPTPRDILNVARRHRRHAKRRRRAQIELGLDAPEVVEQISLISDAPEKVHLLTFAYVPESAEEEEPWYVAEPFGFGASPALRETLETIRQDAGGALRDLLDEITGAALQQHRDHWVQMQRLLREEARRNLEEDLPRGSFADDEPVRDALEIAYLEFARLQEMARAGRVARRDVDAAYMRLRQAVEIGLAICLARHPPGAAWRKIERAPRDASRRTIRACAERIGFPPEALPAPVLKARWGSVKWVCTSPRSSNLRPAVAAFLLAAPDDPDHPFRELAADHPRWLAEVNALADAAGDQVHPTGRRTLRDLEADLRVCVLVLRALMNALGNTTRSRTRHG